MLSVKHRHDSAMDVQEPEIVFDFRSTVIANVMVQGVLFYGLVIANDNPLVQRACILTIVLYWLMVLLAYPRRKKLTLIERIGLRMGLGILLPVSGLLIWLIDRSV